MCSGCSGDYAGEFDDPGEASTNPEEANPPASAGPGAGEQRAEVEEASLPVGGDDHPATAGGCEDENTAEVWEILVSETRIIEIRTMAARDCELKEWAGAGAEKTSAAGQHSIVASAKYYQTRSERAKKSRDRLEMAASCGIGCLLAAEFSRWMQWMRKRLAISSAKNSL